MNSLCARAAATVLVAAAALAALAAASVVNAAPALPTLQADPARTSVSGLSSGGFMAVQYGVAFSAGVKGVGVVAGGPYNCAQRQFGLVDECMTGQPSGAAAWQDAQVFEAAGQIDPLAGVGRQRVYVFAGRNDRTVLPRVGAATRDFYAAAGIAGAALAYVDTLPAGHAFIAPGFGQPCGASAPPFIEQCRLGGRPYDQPRQILRHIHGALKAPAAVLSATVRPFDQSEFGSSFTGLDPTGFVYVPAACAAAAAGACAVHVVFHGCRQGHQSVGPAVYGHAGYNRWADTNRLIVLYPQVQKNELGLPFNPRGCWDWWGLGYTGATYGTRSGVQLSAVKAMVDRLTGR